MDNTADFQSAARHIARAAQQKIKDKTGMRVTLLLYPDADQLKTPRHMLHVIAMSLGMDAKCFKMKTRKRDITELRFLGSVFLRVNFPQITLLQIAKLFGGLDHSSVISGIARAYQLLQANDTRFVKKYDTALKSVNQWLRKEESGYASANSA